MVPPLRKSCSEIAIRCEMEEPVLDKLPSLCHTPKDSGTAAPQATSSGKQDDLLLTLEQNTLLSVHIFSILLSSALVFILACVMVMSSHSAPGPIQDRPMSAALRERLRKTRRSFNANIAVAKRLKINTEEKDCPDADKGCLPKMSTDCSTLQDGSENLEGNGTGHIRVKSPLQESGLCGSAENSCVLQTDLSQQQSLEEKVRLLKQVQEKEELLRRLKLVKMYRSKNNLSELQALIVKWRSSTQLMLYELQSAFSADGKKVSLTQLIDTFGLEDQLLHYSRTEEDFVDS